MLHERLVPYILAAAATARRSGLPIIRPLALVDPADDRGWSISDAYMFGPSLWVAPVLEEGAERRRAYLPRGRWIDFWTGARVEGGRDVVVPAPLDRIPVWVREGSIVVTHPSNVVASGLGEDGVSTRPLMATLWGEPRCGHAMARLADDTRIRWEWGEWSVETRPGAPEREITFAQ
jgi:alpha-glucosidase (family GH31 glycosyl hydrolase)